MLFDLLDPDPGDLFKCGNVRIRIRNTNGNSATPQNVPFRIRVMRDIKYVDKKQTSQIIVKRQDGLTLTINDFNNDHLISLISMFKNN